VEHTEHLIAWRCGRLDVADPTFVTEEVLHVEAQAPTAQDRASRRQRLDALGAQRGDVHVGAKTEIAKHADSNHRLGESRTDQRPAQVIFLAY
jgi:hypothetical protein